MIQKLPNDITKIIFDFIHVEKCNKCFKPIKRVYYETIQSVFTPHKIIDKKVNLCPKCCRINKKDLMAISSLIGEDSLSQFFYKKCYNIKLKQLQKL